MADWRKLSARLGAEFAIVVLGVTIALWADGWVAERSDRAKERARLEALQVNVTSTLADLADELDNLAGAMDALRKISSPDEFELADSEWLFILRYGLLYGSSFEPQMNVYDDLKSSGELALLTSAELRRALARMEAQLQVVEASQADLAVVQELNIDIYLVDHVDLHPIYEDTLDLPAKPAAPPLDFAFMNDIAFRNRALLKLDILAWTEENFLALRTTLEQVAALIDQQLG